jgi:cobalt-zinc-cadmium efflux system outer membrane protein
MTLREARDRLLGQGQLHWLLGPAALALGSLCAVPALSAPPPRPAPPAPMSVVQVPPAVEETPGPLSADAAIRWALQYNPEIAALRQQRGIAAAGIVIARTYPFNPIWDATVSAAMGPEVAGITNVVPITSAVKVELELHHQRRIREQAAAAALSRTEWEVANQELTLAVRVLRAFDTVVYRFRKRQVALYAVDLNQKAAQQVEDFAKPGNKGITAVDVDVIHAELQAARGQLAPATTALVTAWQDLYKALGLTRGSFDLLGGFEVPQRVEDDADQMLQAAKERRPDLRARQLAVNEADARVRLEIANRFGNPAIGNYSEVTESRGTFVGVAFTMPLPVLNTHRGEIQQREVERTRAALELRQNEVTVEQDLRAALARLEQARRWVDTYHREIVPSLEKTLKDVQTLFDNRAPGADLVRLIDVQRKLVTARDLELDAIFELRQALADLAAAVGDPSVAVLPCPNR